mmetsp:Transcript_33677/g.76327  ORF Transcript_33677/g.76327 Transcript_33677/m.76327 type:complete len:200 (+) Transcript_33677:901-1500(+)
MLSIIATTFVKLALRPRSANATKPRRGSAVAPVLCRAACRIRSAWRLTSAEVTLVWIRDGLGRVFLNKFRESSSFRILMVSASARSSPARVICTASHSFCFFLQELSRFAMNFLSACKDAEESLKSPFRVTTSTPTSPERASFAWMASVPAAISRAFAAERDSKSALAFSSDAVASTRAFSMVSFICDMMPRIWPLEGA